MFSVLLNIFRRGAVVFAIAGIAAVSKFFYFGDSDDVPIEVKKYNYHRELLKEKLIEYYEISLKGGWNDLPKIADTLMPGENDSLVLLLKERLKKENYPIGTIIGQDSLFDDKTAQSLMNFQGNNGLEPTGYLENKTIAALNVPVMDKIDKIWVNMERWKSYPKDTVKSYITVNVPDFKLEYVKDSVLTLESKVIVGRKTRQTPEFHAQMFHVIYNPSWHIPPGILRNDIVPVARRNPSYLRSKNINVYKNGRKVSLGSINWSSPYSYSYVQSPGPHNALGVVKLVFPNSYYVYIHDTPSKPLFEKDVRTFSSGCIRAQKAVELSRLLLSDQEEWDSLKIDQTIQNGKTVRVSLNKPLRVYVTYFTAWVDWDGDIQFRKDVYGRDKKFESLSDNMN